MADERKNRSQSVAANAPQIDPTKNVLDLSEASNKRQDDLREADRRYYDAQHQRTRELVTLRAEHSAELREAEAKRIDAIRQVDREAEGKRALELQNTVNTLAANTIGLKDTLQNTVAQTALALENKQAATQAENNRRLSSLELKESQGSGKSSGNTQTVAYLIAGIGVIGTLIGIAIAIITVVVLLRR